MKGTRVYPNELGNLSLKPGEYGKGNDGIWYCLPVKRLLGNLSNHTVTEHEDGTITVSPSILLTDGEGGTEWHGHIERGVFKEC
jgi:hypothetical protein